MAKNENNKEVGKTLTGFNGWMRSKFANTPSGQDPNEENSFESVLDSAISDIIKVINDDAKQEEKDARKIFDAITKLSSIYSTEAIDSFRKSFDEKMTALLGAVYGMTNISVNTGLKTYKSNIGKTVLQKIYDKDNINEVNVQEAETVPIVPAEAIKALSAIDGYVKSILKVVSEPKTAISQQIIPQTTNISNTEQASIDLTPLQQAIQDVLVPLSAIEGYVKTIVEQPHQVVEQTVLPQTTNISNTEQANVDFTPLQQAIKDAVVPLSAIRGYVESILKVVSEPKTVVEHQAIPQANVSNVSSTVSNISNTEQANVDFTPLQQAIKDAVVPLSAIEGYVESILKVVSEPKTVVEHQAIPQANVSNGSSTVSNISNEKVSNISNTEQANVDFTPLQQAIKDAVAPLSAIEGYVSNIVTLNNFQDAMDEMIQAIYSLPDIIKSNTASTDLSNVIKYIDSELVTIRQIEILLQGISQKLSGDHKTVTESTVHHDITFNGSIDTKGLEDILELTSKASEGMLGIDSLVNELNKLSTLSLIPPINLSFLDSLKSLEEGIYAFNVNGIDDYVMQMQIVFDDIKKLSNILDGISVEKSDISSLMRIIDDYYAIIDKLGSSENTNIIDENIDLEKIVNKISAVINVIKDIDVTKEDIKKASMTSDLINAVIGALKVDENKFKNADSVLRRIIKMTEKPGLMTALHMSDRGLIWQIINNISEAARGVNVTESSVEGIGKLLNDIISITDELDEKKLKKFENNIVILNTILDANHLQLTFKTINDIKDVNTDALDNPIKLIKQINKLNAAFDYGTIISLGLKAAIGTEVFKLSSIMLMAISNAAKYADSGKEGLTRIAQALQMISLISPDTLNKISVFIDSINEINFKLAVTAATAPLAKFGIKALQDEISNIEALFSSIPDIATNDSLNAIKDMSNVISAVGKMNVILAAGGMLAPLATVGVFAMLLEMNALAKLTTAISNMDISDKMHDNLKDLGIVVAAAGGVLILSAVTGAYVSVHLGDILGFTVALATFSLAIIGSLNIATRGMQEAKFNAVEIGELVAISAGIMLLGGSIVTMFPELILGSIGFGLALGAFIVTVISAYKFAVTENIAEIKDRIEDIAIVVGASAAIMLLGGGLMAAYPLMIVTLPLFTVLLGGFIAGTLYAYNTFGEGIESALESADKLLAIVSTSAVIMLIGGYLLQEYPWMMLTVPLFGVYLTAFIGAVTYAYNTFGEGIISAQENADKFATLIVKSALSLLIGGYLFQEYPWMMLTVPLFGVYLTAFIGAVTYAYNTFGEGIESALENATDFATLIAISSAALLLGGYVIAENPWMMLTVPLFGVLLSGFVVAIAWAYDKAAGMLKESLKNAESLTTLVAITAATLLIGGAFMLIPGMPEAVLEFGVILAVFTLAISGAYALFARHSKNVMGAALAMSALVVLSGTMLLIGGTMFLENEGLMMSSILFAITTSAFVGTFALLVWGLGSLPTAVLAKGLLSVFAITLIIDSFVNTFKKVNDVAKVMDKDKLFDTLEGMAWIVGGTTVLVGVLAGVITLAAKYLSFGIPGLDWAGLALTDAIIASALGTLAGIVKIVDMTADAMVGIAKASNAWTHMEVPDINKVVDIVTKFTAMTGAISPLANPATILIMQMAKMNISSLSSMLVMIGDAVRNISSLRVPLIENGKIVGVRELDDSDFNKAADNIEKIITTIGGAIIRVYKMHPEIFSSGSTLGDILGMDTEFSRVCKSCAAMGTMISDIAEGVRDYANFRISVYDNKGKKIGSRPFIDSDFESAADNIEKIITTIGGAIITTYEKNPSMFEDTKKWWQPGVRTPFSMVVKSVSGLGKLISDISTGIQSYAELRIPVYDENGNIIGSRLMTDADFSAAGEGISKILVTIGSAIIGTYKAFPEMFDGGSSLLKDIVGGDFGDNPFVIVRKSFEGTGKLISEGVQAIRDVSELQYDIPTAQKKISDILLAIAQSIKNVYDIDPEMFKSSASLLSLVAGNDLGNNPFVIVKKSLDGTGKLIVEAAKAIQEIEKINVDAETAKKKSASYVTAIAQSIKSAYDIDPNLFKQSSSLLSLVSGNDLGNNPFVIVKKSLDGTGKLIVEAAKAIQEIQKIKFDGKIGEKVRYIVNIIPKSILDATVFNTKYGEFWDDDATEKIEDIRKGYDKYVSIIRNITGQYKSIYSFINEGNEKNEVDITALSGYITTMIVSISSAFDNIDVKHFDLNKIKQIINAYEKYSDGIDDIVDIYKSVWKLLNSTGGEDTAKIDMLGVGLIRMISYMNSSIGLLMSDNYDTSLIEVKINSFASSMKTYEEGVRSLAEAFANAPSDFTNYDSLQIALQKINEEIARTPDLDKFKEETGLLKEYVKTINSINSSKIDRLANLADALTTMSTKLGSLEGLTDVLSNKVAGVLGKLSDEMSRSADTINTAQALQSERHKKIDETIKKLKEMMNKPLTIDVKHMAEETQPITPGGATGDNGYSPKATPSATTTTTSTSTPAPVSNSKTPETPTYLKGSTTEKKSGNGKDNITQPFWKNQDNANAGNNWGTENFVTRDEAQAIATQVYMENEASKNKLAGGGDHTGANQPT